MNSLQLSNFLSLDKYTSQYFKGFGSVDSLALPHENDVPALYILNTDVEAGKGEHWCLALYHGDGIEFFDSFGMPPVIYGFERVLSTRRVSYCVYNPICVQNVTSKVCGHHCMFFAYHRCRGVSIDDILKIYHPWNTSVNDKMVLNFALKFGSLYDVKK